MQNALDKLVYSLTGKQNLSACDAGDLKELADRFPYFGAAQFLLAKKGMELGTDEQRDIQKASLFFNNMLHFDQLLRNRETRLTGKVLNQEPESPEQAPYSTPLENPVNDELVVENPAVKTEKAEEPTPIVAIGEAAPALQEAPSQPAAVAPEQTAPVAEATASDEDDPEPIPEENESIRHLLEAESAAAAREQDLVLTPYHTVDYFASQGIRHQADEKNMDRFSMQLRSFTEWLKTLKKTDPETIAAAVHSPSEEKVNNLAAHSLDEKEVLTEAMAEVWVKQGNHQKAIDTYQKLSLQNPAKSAYFASLIEKIKA